MSETSSVQPKFIEMLSPCDRYLYDSLRRTLGSRQCRNMRNRRVEQFSEVLASICMFCIRGDGDDWKRCLVCGVCLIPNGIAFNIKRLKLIVEKCKSSVNGSLQRLGLVAMQNHTDATTILLQTIPFLKQNANELREWTVRQYIRRPADHNANPSPQTPIKSNSSQFDESQKVLKDVSEDIRKEAIEQQISIVESDISGLISDPFLFPPESFLGEQSLFMDVDQGIFDF